MVEVGTTDFSGNSFFLRESQERDGRSFILNEPVCIYFLVCDCYYSNLIRGRVRECSEFAFEYTFLRVGQYCSKIIHKSRRIGPLWNLLCRRCERCECEDCYKQKLRKFHNYKIFSSGDCFVFIKIENARCISLLFMITVNSFAVLITSAILILSHANSLKM